MRTRVEEFATVLIGGGSGQGIGRSLRNLLAGFIRGLQDEDSDQRFRGVTLCEKDPQRYQAIKQELFRLASTPLFADVEVTFDELHLPPLAEPRAGLPRHLVELCGIRPT